MKKYIVIVEHSSQRIDFYVRNEEKAKSLYEWNRTAFPEARISVKLFSSDSLKEYF